jgi:hypothetical protein
MSSTQTAAGITELECVLSASDTYTETLTIRRSDAQPDLFGIVIRTQLLTAKNPLEQRVKARSYVKRSDLIEMHRAIGRFLEDMSDVSPESEADPATR